ncbi:hypothetical protein [Lysinibacillus sp. CTST325]
MSRFASLQGLICDADPQGVAQPPLQSTNIQYIYLNMLSITFSDGSILIFPYYFSFNYFYYLLNKSI